MNVHPTRQISDAPATMSQARSRKKSGQQETGIVHGNRMRTVVDNEEVSDFDLAGSGFADTCRRLREEIGRLNERYRIPSPWRLECSLNLRTTMSQYLGHELKLGESPYMAKWFEVHSKDHKGNVATIESDGLQWEEGRLEGYARSVAIAAGRHREIIRHGYDPDRPPLRMMYTTEIFDAIMRNLVISDLDESQQHAENQKITEDYGLLQTMKWYKFSSNAHYLFRESPRQEAIAIEAGHLPHTAVEGLAERRLSSILDITGVNLDEILISCAGIDDDGRVIIQLQPRQYVRCSIDGNSDKADPTIEWLELLKKPAAFEDMLTDIFARAP